MKGVKLDYKLVGQGGSTIVFESGLGGSYYDWNFVVDEIKQDSTVNTYHRAGYGSSVSTYQTRTTRQITEELNCMLEELDAKDELILVGHSFGGLCIQHFARLYPHKVKGVVLIDSTSDNFSHLYSLNSPVLFSHIAIDKLVEEWEKLSEKSINELQELMNPALSNEQLKLPKEIHEEIRDFSINPVTYKTMSTEMKSWGISSQQIKSSADFPDVPLYVIARDNEVSVNFYIKHGIPKSEAVAYEETWRKLQVEQTLLSKRGKLIIANGSDHNIHLEKPEIIIACIRELMQL